MKIIKRVFSVIVTLFLIGVGISRLGFLVRPTGTDGAYTQIETLHSLPVDSIEVMIFGSSHAFRGVSSMEMYKKYGIGAYNYGWNWQKISTTKIFIKDALLTQTPKVVLLECFTVNGVLMDTNITAEIYYSRYLSTASGRDEYLKQCFQDDKERYLSYYMPLCAFHDNWSTLTQRSFTKLNIETNLRKSMGYASSHKVSPVVIPDYTTFRQAQLTEEATAELDEIVAMCKEKNIEIIFFTVPWQGEYRLGDAMTNYAEENGCVYLDLYKYAEEVGFDGDTDFSDEAHLNESGAIKVADFLGQYIVDNYNVTDMREIEGNLWEEAEAMTE